MILRTSQQFLSFSIRVIALILRIWKSLNRTEIENQIVAPPSRQKLILIVGFVAWKLFVAVLVQICLTGEY